ncbi:SDR family oxidoreductase [Vibrio europaeus]|uniref:UDP-glucose 4-epimerase family protein n=1 Tax=Vibrio europaeus TaxID=300876 RepID=UPI002340FB66|nr:SDR family oxidoreductase [Vibrio europaeus]MDC5850441.1 SDR family oxidoreductase [Vibrio europaeus]
MKILVTGSTGFVGSRVVDLAIAKGEDVYGVVRRISDSATSSRQVLVPDILSYKNWKETLEGIDCVVHCAARVHQMNEPEKDALLAYRNVNTKATITLAKEAEKAGVKKFVFVSSVKVNGEFTEPGSCFSSVVAHPPTDPYGLSKYEAELELLKLSNETDLDVSIIRPPLVYGPGVKANFLSMMKWVDKGIPLPLGAINNSRSLVFVDNLADLILTCCSTPKAAGEVFLVSDNFDISTSQLLMIIASAMNKPNRMLPIPVFLIKSAAKVLGKGEVARRICANLQVDVSKTMKTLDWAPPVSFAQGIEKTVSHFLNSKNS